jgi:hypothetical protein
MVRHGKWVNCPLGRQMLTGLRAKLPADETGVDSSSSWARNRRLPLIACAARGLRTEALVDLVAHM